MLPVNGVPVPVNKKSRHACWPDLACRYFRDRLQCNCGEEWEIFEWNWEEIRTAINVKLSNNNRDVSFHPVYSSGTAAVRGKQNLKQNMHYYWEIKILTNLYGTDIMIGIGTSKIVLSDWKLRYCSMLGYDTESWGYSYRGIIQHNNVSCKYGPRFSIGSLVGIHVDMCAGTLEYYLDRKPLGIAFRGLKDQDLYPMVCSTAAQSAMRITCAISAAPSLQMECLKVINNNAKLIEQYWDIPGLARIIGQKYFWMTPKEETESLELEDEVVLPNEYLDRNFTRRKRFCPPLFEVNENTDDTVHFTCRQLRRHTRRSHMNFPTYDEKNNSSSNIFF